MEFDYYIAERKRFIESREMYRRWIVELDTKIEWIDRMIKDEQEICNNKVNQKSN